ncbi:hypothetical protein V3C99_015620, partial [Haemonchus contortus]
KKYGHSLHHPAMTPIQVVLPGDRRPHTSSMKPVSSQHFCLFNENGISLDMCNKYPKSPIAFYLPYILRVLSIQIIIVMRQRNFQYFVNL